MRRVGTSLAALAAVAVLAGCGILGGDQQATTAPTTVQPESSAPSQSPSEVAPPTTIPSEPPEPATAAPSSPARPTAPPSPARTTDSGRKLPAGAYPGAGGPIPKNATEVTAVNQEFHVGVIVSPTGNIGCDLNVKFSGCGVLSMVDDRKMGSDSSGAPKWWVDLPSGGAPVVGAKGDLPFFMAGDPAAQVVPYGSVVHYADVVCASEENGMTCWNTHSGRGVFMNRDTMSVF